MFKVNTERIRFYAGELDALAGKISSDSCYNNSYKGRSQGPAIEALDETEEEMYKLEKAFQSLVQQTARFMMATADKFDHSDETEAGIL